MSEDLQVWLDKERDLTPLERSWVEKLLSKEFPGRALLFDQLKHAKVIGYCACGCGSINLRVPGSLPAYPYAVRVPVEMQIDPPPLEFLLHVIDGYISELELVWYDPK